MTGSHGSTGTRSDQQTLTEAVESVRKETSRSEVILRIEPDGRYLRLAESVGRSLSLMVNYSDAKRVQENRDGFNSIIPSRHTLTVTGTEVDSDVTDRPRWEVIDFLAMFDRSIRYIPDWSWVTGDQSDHLKSRAVDRYVDRVEFLHNRIEDKEMPVKLLPLAKGLNGKQFERAVETYNRLGIEEIAIYGVQTPSTSALVTRTEQAIAVFEPQNVLVIGRGKPADVAKFPRRVGAIASWRNWMEACDFSAAGYSTEALHMWIDENEQMLKHGHTVVQTDLEGYPKVNEVKADG